MTKSVIQGAHERLQTLVKATVVGNESPEPSSQGGGESDSSIASGFIDPPYDSHSLCLLVEHSNALRQNIDAYATNIDGFGHRLEPAVDFSSDDVDEQIRDIMVLDRSAQKEQGKLSSETPVEPSPSEIQEKKQELTALARSEKARLDAFFESCALDSSFVDLRRKTRQDLEVTGNAYWEVLRDTRGKIARLVYVPSQTVRLLPLDTVATETSSRSRISPVSFEKLSVKKRFRKFVQIQGQSRVFFKSLGDPREISKMTGEESKGAKSNGTSTLQGQTELATEMIHFSIHSPRSPYGVPRWIGNLLSALGSRQMEEVNHAYFENKSVPPLALLVSGGRLSDQAVPRIERFIEENLKGKSNFHKMLILEAEGSGGKDSRAKIEIKPLTDAQQQDALFQLYDERNIEKIGSAFRLPKLLRGESKDFNRSTAESALRFAEDQVFQPERNEFDDRINRQVFSDMEIRFWKFRSQTPVTRDPERMTQMVEKLVRVGVVTPEEGRALASDIFNREFRKIGDDWVKRPITLTLAGIQNWGAEKPEPSPIPREFADVVKGENPFRALREELLQEETRLISPFLNQAREEWMEKQRLEVPQEEFHAWFSSEEHPHE